jgi:hypothetical protein
MRRWRCFPVLRELLARAALASAAALPLTLGACAISGPLPAAQVGSIGASATGSTAQVAGETPGAALQRQFADATAQLAALLQTLPGACSSPCLSPAEEDAIIARAIAEHEMRRP